MTMFGGIGPKPGEDSKEVLEVNITVKVSNRKHAWLKAEAELKAMNTKEKISVADIVRVAIDEYVARHGGGR